MLSNRSSDVQGRAERPSAYVLTLACQLVAWLLVFHNIQNAAAEMSLPSRLNSSPGTITPVAVFGDDDRSDLPESLSALEGRIGMLYEQSTQTLCTAFCVARNIVATAAHCLFQRKNGRLPNLTDVTFRLNYGKTYQQSGIYGRRTPYTKHFIAVGTTAFKNEPPLSAPRDWALVKLENPVCRFGTLDVEPKPVHELIQASAQGRIFQIAYHWDYKHWRLAYSKPCRIQQDYDQIKWRFIRKHFVDDDQLLLHTCDTGGASSGSPLLLNRGPDKTPAAVAINVGTYTRTRILLRKGQVVKKLNPDIIANTGVNGTAFQHVINKLQNAQLIVSYDDMVHLQSELAARGLYTGIIDGKLGRGTRGAITSFETSIGLPPTGLPTLTLLHQFGEERVRPNHTYSNAQGEFRTYETDVSGEGGVSVVPKQVIIPAPKRRPALKARHKPFNPFPSIFGRQ